MIVENCIVRSVTYLYNILLSSFYPHKLDNKSSLPRGWKYSICYCRVYWCGEQDFIWLYTSLDCYVYALLFSG